MEESEECRILSHEQGVTRIEDTFGKAKWGPPGTAMQQGLNRSFKSFFKISTTNNRRVEYDPKIFDGLGDGNLYWSKDKGYDASKRNMWGNNWGPGFYAWSIGRFSILEAGPWPDKRFLFTDFKGVPPVLPIFPNN